MTQTQPGYGDAPGFRPLYRQVRDALIRRMVEGTLAPGEPLPSETELARAFGVSQGTVRKALDALAADNIVLRRQGRGTYVAPHDEQRILFQFFKFQPDGGAPAFPESRLIAAAVRSASPEEAARLRLTSQADVIAIRRVRSLRGETVIVERIATPAALFPGLIDGPVPNNLYGVYAGRYGVAVARGVETLKAVAAPPDDAGEIGLPPGAPALLVDRLAIALDGAPVEWRVSLCRTDGVSYVVELR